MATLYAEIKVQDEFVDGYQCDRACDTYRLAMSTVRRLSADGNNVTVTFYEDFRPGARQLHAVVLCGALQ